MNNYRFVCIIRRVILMLILVIIALLFLNTVLNLLNKDINKNITTEIKVGKIIDSSKENISGILGGHIEYETAIKVDDEIIISNNKDIYYEAVDKIGKEVKVEIENNKNINTKIILDIK